MMALLHRILAIAFSIILLTLWPMPATAQQVVVASKPINIGVTVYRDPERGRGGEIELDFLRGFALISETRTVQLLQGENQIQFKGVAGGIIPVSAVVTGLPGGVIQKNRDTALLSPASLLDGSLGNHVSIRRTDRKTGKVIESDAIVRTGSGGAVVLQTAKGIEALRCSGLPETLIYSGMPGGLSAEPTLSVNTISPAPVTATVTLTYLATGFDWAANYVATVAPNGKTLDLFAWLTVANSNAESFPKAQLVAVAGTLEKQEDDDSDDMGASPSLNLRCYPLDSTSTAPRWSVVPSPDGSPRIYEEGEGDEIVVVTGSRIRGGLSFDAPVAVATVASQEELGDLKLYRVPFQTTVAANAQKQVALLVKTNVPFTQTYFYDTYINDDFQQEQASIELGLDNKRDGPLGVPLPSGGIALFRNHDGQDLLVNEGRLADYAVSQIVKLPIGETPQVLVTWEELEKGQHKNLDIWRALVTNANSFPVEFELRLRGGQNIQIDGKLPSSFERREAGWVWRVRVPAEKSKTMSIRIRRDS